ncbi:hypothetical protein ZWY2020_017363 [Hordeum vulgare]|nr:hypothetical protein ZWY2020_017363 [Hordeum vulgare]
MRLASCPGASLQAATARPSNLASPASRPRLRWRWPRLVPSAATSDQQALLAALREQADPEAALRMLNSALARDNFAPGRDVYEEIIRSSGRPAPST